MLVSVVICTYNRSDILCKCLQSLKDQSLDKHLFEVIVADNNSTDNTLSLVEKYIQEEPNFRFCLEEKRGANHARNAGVSVAKGEYIAFIDDDAVAYPDWLANILEFAERRPDIVVFGGPHESYTIVQKPEWFPPEYGVFSLGNEERPIQTGKEWIIGTNMVVNKNAFLSVRGFNQELTSVVTGKNGNVTACFQAGEETRLLVELTKEGHIPYYVPSIKVKHLVREEKLSLAYLLRGGYLMGRSHTLTFNKRNSVGGLLISLVILIVKAITVIIPKGMPVKRRLYYALLPLCYQLGALVDEVRRSRRSLLFRYRRTSYE